MNKLDPDILLVTQLPEEQLAADWKS